jgi:hypothetical protein
MSVDYLVEIFGGTGAVILGVGTCIWGCLKSYELKYDYDEEDKEEPIYVLDEEWETRGESFSLEEDFGHNWNRLKFATKENDNWNVNINKNEGSVYIYTKKDRLPPKCNDGKHFLRINIKNVTKNMKVKFEQKFFDISYNGVHHDNECKPIKKDGVHIFEPDCIIDLQNNHENVVKKEQLGVYITGKNKEIKNIIIDEAYYGEKWNFCNICCCKKKILYRKKQKED